MKIRSLAAKEAIQVNTPQLFVSISNLAALLIAAMGALGIMSLLAMLLVDPEAIVACVRAIEGLVVAAR